ncbi:hypothetical protein D3C83_15540 [compost metagenome]
MQPAAAQAVDGERGRILGQPALQRGDAREVHVARLGMNHVADDAGADFFRIELRTLHRLLDHLRRQLGRRHVLQRAAVIADRRPHAGQHHHIASAAHNNLLTI